MISVWLGDRSGWTGVHLAELDRAFVDRSSGFVDRSAGFVDRSERWVGGSERWFVDRSSGLWIGALGWWIGALVCGSKLVLSVCAFVLCFSSLFLSVLLCVESGLEMN